MKLLYRHPFRTFAAPNVLLSAALMLSLSTSLPSYAEDLDVNLDGADIRQVIKVISDVTGKSFIVDPRVKGQKISVVTSRKMTKAQLYETFLSILDVHGYSAVESGSITKIIPKNQAKQNPLPVVDEKSDNEPDELVTRVVRVEHVPVAQLVPILRPLIPNDGQLQAYAPSNTLLISDRSSNIDRVIEVIKRMDREDDEQIEVVKLEYAAAEKLVSTMQALEKKGDKPIPTSTRVAADDRTNSILIAGEKAARKRVREIIEKLDTKAIVEGGTRVVPLRHAKAEELVEVLKTTSSAEQQQQATAEGKQPAARSSEIAIQADKSSNAIVITAPVETQKDLVKVIRQLDLPRKQVLVEAIIAEVSTNMASELGVQLAYDGVSGDNTGPVLGTNFGGAGPSLAEAIAGAPTLTSGLLLGLGGINLGNRFGVLLKALSGDAATNILSTPTIVTVNNEEAEIVVGQNVPFITGSFSGTGTTGGSNPSNPFQTIQRQDVGLTLKVTPQINQGNTINMKIQQEVSSLASSSTGASDLITNTRKISTNVVVGNGQILVLGGLIQDAFRDSEEKVPVLGSLPGIGGLFRYTTTSKTKENLMAFIHPVIINQGRTSDKVSRNKYQALQQQQNKSNILQRGRFKQHATRFPNIDQVISEDPNNPRPKAVAMPQQVPTAQPVAETANEHHNKKRDPYLDHAADIIDEYFSEGE
ncbi:MAG: type II secretion system secretin GspD [bacterium]